MSIDNTRARILDTTKKLLVDNGEQATSMSLISKVSQVSMGSIYNLFESKDDLITAVYIDCRDRLLQNCYNVPKEAASSPKATLRCMNRNYLESALANPYEFKLVTKYHLTPMIDCSLFRPSDFASEVSDQTIAFYTQQGILKDMSPTVLDFIMFGIINQIVKAHFAGFLVITDDMKEKILNICWDAVSTHIASS